MCSNWEDVRAVLPMASSELFLLLGKGERAAYDLSCIHLR